MWYSFSPIVWFLNSGGRILYPVLNMSNIFSLSNPAYDYTTQNPGIITNGLISYYEFNNPNCYIGNGTVVRDLVTPLDNTGQLDASSVYAYNINTGSMIFTAENYPNQKIICTANGFD